MPVCASSPGSRKSCDAQLGITRACVKSFYCHFPLPIFYMKSQKYFISDIFELYFRIQTRYDSNKQKQDLGDLHTGEPLKYSCHQLGRVLCPSWCFHASVPLHHCGYRPRFSILMAKDSGLSNVAREDGPCAMGIFMSHI